MIEKTLYEILGVPADATDDQIKRAFRKRVKRAHPDAGGDAEKFRTIQHAYEVLSDPERRKRYNETGQGADPKMADAMQKAAMILSSLVLDLMNANPQGCNVVEGARNMLKAKIEALRSASASDLQRAQTLNGVAELVEKKGAGDNLIAIVIASHGDQCKAHAEALTKQIEGLTDVLRMLDDYSWKPDSERANRQTGIPELRGYYSKYFING